MPGKKVAHVLEADLRSIFPECIAKLKWRHARTIERFLKTVWVGGGHICSIMRTCAVVKIILHQYAELLRRPGLYVELHPCNCVLATNLTPLRTQYSAVMLYVMEPEEWKLLVGNAVQKRRRELGIKSMRKAAAMAGYNEAVWRQVETGKRQLAPGHMVAPTPKPDTQAAICAVLEWTADSIDRLLNGDEPAVLVAAGTTTGIPKDGHDGTDGWPAWLENWLKAEIGSVRQALGVILERVEALEAQEQNPPA